MTVRDLPEPTPFAADVADFPVPVYGFVPQPRLQFYGHGTMRGGSQLREVSISYSYLATPEQPKAESNFVDNIEEVRAWQRKAELDDQPDWFKQTLDQAHYPMLWEAVLTAIDPDGLDDLDEHLANHVNHLLVNTMPHRVARGADQVPRLDHHVRPSHSQSATITVAGWQLPGLTIDTDPNVVGWATRVAEAIVVIGLPREKIDDLKLALEPLTTPTQTTAGN